jgi:NADH:ubiquinone oxidoreductase subunit 2 (subunit N)
LLGVFVLSSILALIAYVLSLTRSWLGSPQSTEPPQRGSESLALRGAIIGLVATLLITGIWPHVLELLQWGRL